MSDITFSVTDYSYTISGYTTEIDFSLTLGEITRDTDGKIKIPKKKCILSNDSGQGTDYFDIDLEYSFDNSNWTSTDVFYVDAPSGYRILAHDLYYHPDDHYEGRWAGGEITEWTWHSSSSDPYGGRWWIDKITWDSDDTPSGDDGHFKNISITQTNKKGGTLYLKLAYRGHINTLGFDSWHETSAKSVSYPKVSYSTDTKTPVTASKGIILAANQTKNQDFYGLWNRVNTICEYDGLTGLRKFSDPSQYTTEITLTNYGAVLNKIKELANETEFAIPDTETEACTAMNNIKNTTYTVGDKVIPQLSDYCTVVNYWTANNI